MREKTPVPSMRSAAVGRSLTLAVARHSSPSAPSAKIGTALRDSEVEALTSRTGVDACNDRP